MTKPIGFILLSISLAVMGQVFLKIGMSSLKAQPAVTLIVKGLTTPLVLLGLFLYVLSALIWLIVLSRTELSFAYPFIGLSYILILIISWLFLGEDVRLIRWLGTLIICLGVILISRS